MTDFDTGEYPTDKGYKKVMMRVGVEVHPETIKDGQFFCCKCLKHIIITGAESHKCYLLCIPGGMCFRVCGSCNEELLKE